MNHLFTYNASLPIWPVAMPQMTPAEHESFSRFCDCCEDLDAGGHDVPKEMMATLVRIGLVRHLGFGRFQTTDFGDCVRAAEICAAPGLTLIGNHGPELGNAGPTNEQR